MSSNIEAKKLEFKRTLRSSIATLNHILQNLDEYEDEKICELQDDMYEVEEAIEDVSDRIEE